MIASNWVIIFYFFYFFFYFFFGLDLFRSVLLLCKYTNLCSYVQVFVIIFLIFFIYFQLPLGLNKQFISVLQIFVGTWDKMEAQG